MKRVLPEFITDAGKNFARKTYAKEEKNILVDYLKNRGELFEAGGYVKDIVSDSFVKIEDGGYRDGEYEWSTQDIYHIEKYDAAVRDDFLSHVLNDGAEMVYYSTGANASWG